MGRENSREDYKLCVSSSITPFRKKAEKAWGLKRYKWPDDIFKPAVFFGMYHIGDYWHFTRHLGKKIVFWTGTDILNLKKNTFPIYLLFKRTECYCENELEERELKSMGIKAIIRPTLLEDIDDFPVSFKPYTGEQELNVFLSANRGKEEEYGWNLVSEIGESVPFVHFHFYGAEGNNAWNKTYHGKVSNKQFNKEIKEYHAGLRPNEHDGFSEITAKSVLMGQYPITRIKYPMIDHYETKEELIKLLKELKNKKKPNIKARNYYRKHLNELPFVNKGQ